MHTQARAAGIFESATNLNVTLSDRIAPVHSHQQLSLCWRDSLGMGKEHVALHTLLYTVESGNHNKHCVVVLLQPGAVDVFLDFISYSGGPLPERLLEQMPAGVPVSILWGADDPWEDMKEGRRLFAHWPCVTGKGPGLCSMSHSMSCSVCVLTPAGFLTAYSNSKIGSGLSQRKQWLVERIALSAGVQCRLGM